MKLQWNNLIPIDRHVEFLTGERKYCKAEEDAFGADSAVQAAWHNDETPDTESNIEELRTAVLDKRQEYLLHYLEHELV